MVSVVTLKRKTKCESVFQTSTEIFVKLNNSVENATRKIRRNIVTTVKILIITCIVVILFDNFKFIIAHLVLALNISFLKNF